MMAHKLNPSIAHIPMPPGVKKLPIAANGFPVPWFVKWLDDAPEFRVADGAKHALAIRERRCWVCGERLDNRATFPIGPMCALNRVTSEPPCHPACAEYSVRACPFLARPNMVRREGGIPEEAGFAGHAIERNPGVVCLWTGRWPGAERFGDGMGGMLFRIFPPLAVEWWAEGRKATRAEVMASVESGLPLLRDMAEKQGPLAIEALERMFAEAQPLFERISVGGSIDA